MRRWLTRIESLKRLTTEGIEGTEKEVKRGGIRDSDHDLR